MQSWTVLGVKSGGKRHPVVVYHAGKMQLPYFFRVQFTPVLLVLSVVCGRGGIRMWPCPSLLSEHRNCNSPWPYMGKRLFINFHPLYVPPVPSDYPVEWNSISCAQIKQLAARIKVRVIFRYCQCGLVWGEGWCQDWGRAVEMLQDGVRHAKWGLVADCGWVLFVLQLLKCFSCPVLQHPTLFLGNERHHP